MNKSQFLAGAVVVLFAGFISSKKWRDHLPVG